MVTCRPPSLRAGKNIVTLLPYHQTVKLVADRIVPDLKRELISEQTQSEISELSSPTALQRFGAPFRSDAGEVAPEDSELPLLRYIFVHHVRNFPFLDAAREKEFWQDKLQVVRRPPALQSTALLTAADHSFSNPLRNATYRLRKTASKRQSVENSQSSAINSSNS